MLEELIIEGVSHFGVELDKNRASLFIKYMDILKEWNQKFNLTSIEDEKEIIIKHFIDSASIFPYIKRNEIGTLVDIGTGAGFPGIPVKIAFDKVHVTLVDSVAKKTLFLKEVISCLGLKDIVAINGRAEDLGASYEHREKYDAAVARAVASLPVLLEYCLPLVRQGGVFIAMKGMDIDEEVGVSKKALEVLGGEIEEINKLNLPHSDIVRNIIIVRKLRRTPTLYPRKAGKPSKKPLT